MIYVNWRYLLRSELSDRTSTPPCGWVLDTKSYTETKHECKFRILSEILTEALIVEMDGLFCLIYIPSDLKLRMLLLMCCGLVSLLKYGGWRAMTSVHSKNCWIPKFELDTPAHTPMRPNPLTKTWKQTRPRVYVSLIAQHNQLKSGRSHFLLSMRSKTSSKGTMRCELVFTSKTLLWISEIFVDSKLATAQDVKAEPEYAYVSEIPKWNHHRRWHMAMRYA
jgi:hypothetical protein